LKQISLGGIEPCPQRVLPTETKESCTHTLHNLEIPLPSFKQPIPTSKPN